MRRVTLALLVSLLVACDSAPQPRYKLEHGLFVDLETGQTYRADDAQEERERYREELIKRGAVMPGLPMFLTPEQRQELAGFDDVERTAKEAEKAAFEALDACIKKDLAAGDSISDECQLLAALMRERGLEP